MLFLSWLVDFVIQTKWGGPIDRCGSFSLLRLQLRNLKRSALIHP